MPAKRNTVQKELILETVRDMHNHPTAEEIYLRVSAVQPTISRATVYRNLSQLSEQKVIRRVSNLNAADRYDFHTAPHYHFHCSVCNKVYDVHLPYNSALLAEVENPEGFLFEGYEIVFKGLCPKCRAKH